MTSKKRKIEQVLFPEYLYVYKADPSYFFLEYIFDSTFDYRPDETMTNNEAIEMCFKILMSDKKKEFNKIIGTFRDPNRKIIISRTKLKHDKINYIGDLISRPFYEPPRSRKLKK